MKNFALIVAGTIFFIAAVLHGVRLVYKIEILIGGHVVPMTASIAGAIVGLVLAVWMFRAVR